jgi:hypothetical protein
MIDSLIDAMFVGEATDFAWSSFKNFIAKK